VILVWNEKVFLKELKCDFDQTFVQLNKRPIHHFKWHKSVCRGFQTQL